MRLRQCYILSETHLKYVSMIMSVIQIHMNSGTSCSSYSDHPWYLHVIYVLLFLNIKLCEFNGYCRQNAPRGLTLRKTHKDLIYQHICIILTKHTGVNMRKKQMDLSCDVAQGSLRNFSPIWSPSRTANLIHIRDTFYSSPISPIIKVIYGQCRKFR